MIILNFYIRKYYKLVSSYADISRKSVECISMQPKQMEWLISLYGSLISLTGLSVLAYQAIKTWQLLQSNGPNMTF